MFFLKMLSQHDVVTISFHVPRSLLLYSHRLKKVSTTSSFLKHSSLFTFLIPLSTWFSPELHTCNLTPPFRYPTGSPYVSCSLTTFIIPIADHHKVLCNFLLCKTLTKPLFLCLVITHFPQWILNDLSKTK